MADALTDRRPPALAAVDYAAASHRALPRRRCHPA